MSQLATGLQVEFRRIGSPLGGFMSFGIYLAGYIILIIGLATGAHLLHVSNQWIGVGVLVLVGLGIVKGVASTRQRDPS